MGLFSTYTPPAQGVAQGYIQQLGNVGNAQAGLATAAGNAYSTDNGTYRQNLGGYEDMLGRGIGQQAIDAATGQATANTANNYTQAASNLRSTLANSGFGMGGAAAGGLSHLDAARAGALSTAANVANTNAQNQNYARAGQLNNLEAGVAGTDYGRQAQAYGAEGNIDTGLISANEQLAQQQAAQHQSALQQASGFLGSLGSLYGMYKGYGGTPGSGAGNYTGFGVNPPPAPSAYLPYNFSF